MKLAVTYENGSVFQHFGKTAQFRVYEIEDGQIKSAKTVDTNGAGHSALAVLLKELGADALICGGIGAGAVNALGAAGIDLYPGVFGNADEAAQKFAAGELEFDPDAHCSHHGSEHGHSCSSGGCTHKC